MAADVDCKRICGRVSGAVKHDQQLLNKQCLISWCTLGLAAQTQKENKNNARKDKDNT